MAKIVNGIPFIGTRCKYAVAHVLDLGHGHLEFVAYRPVAWVEADWSESVLADHLAMVAKDALDRADEIRVANQQRSARRAKTRVRRLCKALGVDTLLTLTYKSNMQDLKACKVHLHTFNQRMLRVLPGFAFVACFERQKRGAWHVHIATAGIPTLLPVPGGGDFRSYNVIRAVWRSVVGDAGGNIDVARRRRNCRKSSAAIAAYIAKYIGKTFEDGDVGFDLARWAKYGFAGDAVKIPVCDGVSLTDAIGELFGWVSGNDVVFSANVDKYQNWFFMACQGRGGGSRISVA